MARASIRRHIDHETGDYVLENGGPKEDSTVLSSVILAVRMKRGSCPVAPELGSRLHEVRKATREAPRLVEAYLLEAVKHLSERGEIRDVRAKANVQNQALSWELSFRDRTGKRRTVSDTQGLR